MDWNWSEQRLRVDKWPGVEATVSDIDQPFSSPKFAFLSVITFRFKDESGEYHAGKYQMPTRDLPDGFMTGSKITIRYNPKNPDKSWCEDDYFRSGFGRWQSFGFPLLFWSLVGVTLLLVALISLIKSR